MTDVKLLEEAVAASGLLKKHIAKCLGITWQGLAEKMKGNTEFKASEIKTMQELLHLTNEQRDKIFFAA